MEACFEASMSNIIDNRGMYILHSGPNNEFSKQYLSGHVMMIYCDRTKRYCCQEFPQKSLVVARTLTRMVTMLTRVDEAPERNNLSSGLHQSGKSPVTAEVSHCT